MTAAPRIWVLLGPRTGDNNQAMALAEALGGPFETRTLDYTQLQALSVWLPPTALTLGSTSRKQLQAPWPDLVITIGRRSVIFTSERRIAARSSQRRASARPQREKIGEV